MSTLSTLQKFTDTLPVQSEKMPVLFTSHGNPMDIPKSRDERPFWNTLFELGEKLQNQFEIKAALVVSAHWCTNNQTKVKSTWLGKRGQENSFNNRRINRLGLRPWCLANVDAPFSECKCPCFSDEYQL